MGSAVTYSKICIVEDEWMILEIMRTWNLPCVLMKVHQCCTFLDEKLMDMEETRLLSLP